MYERKFEEAARKTTLPDNPDMKKVGAFVERINRHAVMEDYDGYAGNDPGRIETD